MLPRIQKDNNGFLSLVGSKKLPVFTRGPGSFKMPGKPVSDALTDIWIFLLQAVYFS